LGKDGFLNTSTEEVVLPSNKLGEASENLPSPPTETEKYCYCQPEGKLLSVIGLICLAVFLVNAALFFSKHLVLLPYAFFCLIYLANIGFCSFGFALAKTFDRPAHEALKTAHAAYTPSVDVFLPNCGEDVDLLDNAFAAMSRLDYPNFKVYVLDDVGRAEVKALAEKYDFFYLCRPNKGELKKAGNMRYAFARTSGELILVFDADFAPRRDFLKETVFYFSKNPKLGILQTPQFFELRPEQSDIQKGATFLQEVFYRLIQNFRDRWGASVCTGSCALYRRSALEPFGGAAPVERSEDVNTGLSVLRTGWHIEYLPLNLSKGLSPDTISGFFTQQYRWCSGSIHLITSRLFWQQNISLLGKFSYLLSILYYVTSGLGVFMFSLPSIINVWCYPGSIHVANYAIMIPSIMALLMVRSFWSHAPWGVYCLTTAAAAAYTHLISLMDVLTKDVAPWIPTGASHKTKDIKFNRFKSALHFIPVAQICLFFAGAVFNWSKLDLVALLPSAGLLTLNLLLTRLIVEQIAVDERGGKIAAAQAHRSGEKAQIPQPQS